MPISRCVIARFFPPEFGGGGLRIFRMLPLLKMRGVSSTVIANEYSSYYAVFRDEDSQARVCRILARNRYFIFPVIFNHLKLAAHFEKKNPPYDVVHFVSKLPEILGIVPRLKKRNIPVIAEMTLLNEDDPLSLTRDFLGTAVKKILPQIDLWIGMTRTFLPRMAEAGIPAEKFRYVPSGVDTDRFKPVENSNEKKELRLKLGLPVGRPSVICVGSICYRKGIRRLLEVWKRMNGAEDEILLLLVGPESSELDRGIQFGRSSSQKIRNEIGKWRLEKNVKITGAVDNVEDYLRASDAFVLLSKREGMPNALLEAMACGLPCLVSPLEGAAREVIENGKDGIIVEDADAPDAVARAVSDILRDNEKSSFIGRNAAAKIRNHFTLSHSVEKLVAVYSELTGKK